MNRNVDSYGPTLYLVRHGETDYNRNKIFQGRFDIPLNENGLRQAEELRLILASVVLTKAFVSPLGRARATAEIILRDRGVPIVIEPRLIELDFGAWEGVAEEEVKRRWEEDYRNYREDMSRFCPKGGESAVEAQARAGEWWEEVKRAHSTQDESILVVAHQSLNAVLACYVTGMGLEHAWEHFKCRPAEVLRIAPGKVPLVSRLAPSL